MAVQVRYQPPAIDPRVLMAGLTVAAETAGADVLLAASQPLVPVDKGALVASGHVEHDGDSAAVGYSATNQQDGYDYARIQHENEDFQHEHGQAHYLADPMHTAGPAILVAVIAELRK